MDLALQALCGSLLVCMREHAGAQLGSLALLLCSGSWLHECPNVAHEGCMPLLLVEVCNEGQLGVDAECLALLACRRDAVQLLLLEGDADPHLLVLAVQVAAGWHEHLEGVSAASQEQHHHRLVGARRPRLLRGGLRGSRRRGAARAGPPEGVELRREHRCLLRGLEAETLLGAVVRGQDNLGARGCQPSARQENAQLLQRLACGSRLGELQARLLTAAPSRCDKAASAEEAKADHRRQAVEKAQCKRGREELELWCHQPPTVMLRFGLGLGLWLTHRKARWLIVSIEEVEDAGLVVRELPDQ
mmetsp:Transcript_90038/g.250092  ORF Transcript_90038/g.250092 Transcript_90038/m.250092 type:complete len:303 (-) Transcript_90038:843-1751(-)